jgi:hypothetical protein
VVNTKPVNSDAEDGLYIIYFLLTMKGKYEVAIRLNGIQIDSSPFSLEAKSGAVSAAHSNAVGL